MNLRLSSMLVGGMLGAAATLYWYRKKPSAVAAAANGMAEILSSAMNRSKAKMKSAVVDKQMESIFSERLKEAAVHEESTKMNH